MAHSEKKGQNPHDFDHDSTHLPSSQSPHSDAGEDFPAAELEEGYEYVTPEELKTTRFLDEDESLTRQLFQNGTVIEKRSISERFSDLKEHQAALKAEKEALEQEARRKRLVTGLAAARAAEEAELRGSRTDDSRPQGSRRGLILTGALAMLSLMGASSLFALSTQNDPVRTQSHVSSPEASPSQVTSSASSSAPRPSWTTKAPEVTYAEVTQAPVAPGQIDYIQAPATSSAPDVAQEPLAPAPVLPANPVSSPPPVEVESAPASVEATPSEEASQEPTQSPAPAPVKETAPSGLISTSPTPAQTPPAQTQMAPQSPAQTQQQTPANTQNLVPQAPVKENTAPAEAAH